MSTVFYIRTRFAIFSFGANFPFQKTRNSARRVSSGSLSSKARRRKVCSRFAVRSASIRSLRCTEDASHRDAATGNRRQLFHQQHRAAALDLARDFSVHVCRHASDAARKNLAAFTDEFFQEIGILVIDRFERDIDPTPWHGWIAATEGGTAQQRYIGIGYLIASVAQGTAVQRLSELRH